MRIDFIGDIHGHADKLEELLQKLDYKKQDGVYTHKNRKVLFVGDYIDRGPKIRETLEIVKSMADTGNAIALMGNHEYNMLCFQYQKPDGTFLRSHSKKNIRQVQETLRQFENHPDEFKMYLDWFKTLPLYYETQDFRAVHACWEQENIDFLRNKLESNRITDSLLIPFAERNTEFYKAIDVTLKGKEISLPPGKTFKDKDGAERNNIRIKWWVDPGKMTYKSLCVHPVQNLSDEIINTADLFSSNYYSDHEKPVFFRSLLAHWPTFCF